MIKKKSRVIVVKKNQIIPQIISATGGTEEFVPPSICPICFAPTIIPEQNEDGTRNLWCVNKSCMAKDIRMLEYFVSNECMNIKGVSGKTIQKLIESGFIHSVYDIYDLSAKREELVSLEGFGESSVDSMLSAIEESRTVKLENFIAAMSIPNIGLTKAEVISKRFNGSWTEFKKAVDEDFDFTELEGFGVEVAKNIREFFATKFEEKEYSKLSEIMNFIVPDKKADAEMPLKGMVFVITGDVHIFTNRNEVKSKIVELGGKVSGSVSKKTTYLINNDMESASSKNQAAKEIGVPIITEEDFIKLYN